MAQTNNLELKYNYYSKSRSFDGKMSFNMLCMCVLPLCSIYSNSSHVG